MNENPWSGYHLRFAYLPFSPFYIPYVDSTGRERLHGLLGSLLDNVTYSMNITLVVLFAGGGGPLTRLASRITVVPTLLMDTYTRYSLTFPPDMAYGQVDFETGEVLGMPRAVMDGVADVACGPLIVQEAFFDNLYELSRASVTFTRGVLAFGMKDAYITSTASFTDAVDIYTWLGLLGFGAALIGLVILHEYVYPTRQVPMWLTLSRWSFTFFGILLQEATSSKPPKIWYDRLIRGVWMIGCMLLSYIFLGTLRASLVVLTPTERMNKIDQFLNYPERPIYVGANTPTSWLIAVYPGERGERLRAHYARNRVEIEPFSRLREIAVMEPMFEKKGGCFFEELYIRLAIARWCVETNYYFHIMDEEIARVGSAIYTSKNLPIELNRALDKKIMWIEAMGVPFMQEREVLGGGNLGCIAGVDKKASEFVEQVNLGDLSAVATSLILGLIVSTIVFTIELAYSSCVRCTSRARLKRKQNLQ